jgi:hypothetical protein
MPLELNGTTGVQGNSGAFVAGTAVASTSGTSIDFTSIPSWVKRITVMLNSVSTNSTSLLALRLGTVSGIESTGYTGQVSDSVNGSPVVITALSTYFAASGYVSSSAIYSGSLVLTLVGSNTWVCNGAVSGYTYNGIGFCVGVKTLSGTLDRVRITTANGTDLFDAGSINILYE